MPRPLSTKVNGSSTSCRIAAERLDTWERLGQDAGDQAGRGINLAESSWDGPAFEAFRDAIAGLVPGSDDLAHSARLYANALRDFSSSLDAVKDRVQVAIDKAVRGGLEVTDESILPPVPTGWARIGLPSSGDITKAAQQGSLGLEFELRNVSLNIDQLTEREEYRSAVDEHNRKVDVFNECKAVLCEARRMEEESHSDLHRVLVPQGQDEFTEVTPEEGAQHATGSSLNVATELSEHHKAAWARAGAAFTVGTEIAKAAAGEQPWTVAAARSGGTLTAGAVISRILYAVPHAKPIQIGKGLVTFLAGLAGGHLGEHVADFFLAERKECCDEPPMSRLPYGGFD
ncbi:hypothetical protein [Amycolatopsis cihanbeyliensis]|uniref:Uncharacterized protein n=1 Tax=Amycolatopsis cihanbeyliensis TaxID=1128664 RepID=A0A542DR90_AMYCI|nr:hypothetical protein [Amycolatopsis cihanbeyliensis]TQJ05623.1 hypothetical protein FB471_5460 [Amycolatopsis cihanbeyliensis]